MKNKQRVLYSVSDELIFEFTSHNQSGEIAPDDLKNVLPNMLVDACGN